MPLAWGGKVANEPTCLQQWWQYWWRRSFAFILLLGGTDIRSCSCTDGSFIFHLQMYRRGISLSLSRGNSCQWEDNDSHCLERILETISAQTSSQHNLNRGTAHKMETRTSASRSRCITWWTLTDRWLVLLHWIGVGEVHVLRQRQQHRDSLPSSVIYKCMKHSSANSSDSAQWHACTTCSVLPCFHHSLQENSNLTNISKKPPTATLQETEQKQETEIWSVNVNMPKNCISSDL